MKLYAKSALVGMTLLLTFALLIPAARAVSAAWDGDMIAVVDSDGTLQLIDVNLGTALSPPLEKDYSSIGAFSWNSARQLVFMGISSDQTTGIYVWDSTGLLYVSEGIRYVGSPAWSADGWLVFSGRDTEAGNDDLFVWDGQQPVNITNSTSVSEDHELWSADGRIVFSGSGGLQVWEDGVTHKIALTPFGTQFHRWSADGRIAFSTINEKGTWILYVWDEGTIHEIASNLVRYPFPEWSTNGRLAFTTETSAGSSVFIWDDGTLIPVAATFQSARNFRWSSDGRLLIGGLQAAGESESLWVWDNGTLTQIPDSTSGFLPVWGPNGQVAFLLNAGSFAIAVWDGQTVTPVFDIKYDDTSAGIFAWSSSGKLAIMEGQDRNDADLYVWENGEARLLRSNLYQEYAPAWMPQP